MMMEARGEEHKCSTPLERLCSHHHRVRDIQLHHRLASQRPGWRNQIEQKKL
jgi:hypothetical protein